MNETNTQIITMGINASEEAKKLFGHHHLHELENENHKRRRVDYAGKCYRMVSEYLKHTDFDILVGTNEPDRFKDLGPRVKTIFKEQSIEEYRQLQGFSEYIKLEMLAEGYKEGYDVNYWIDADNGVEGWHEKSWKRLIENNEHNVYGNTNMNPTPLASWSDVEADRCFTVHSCLEDRLIFTNRDVFKRICDMWMDEDRWDILFKHDRWKAMGGTVGVVIGETIKNIGGSYHFMNPDFDRHEFAHKERVYHKEGDKKLNRWWRPVGHVYASEE